MNPCHWPRAHQLALALATLLGIPCGVILGFIVHALGYGREADTFSYWFKSRPESFGWAVFGALLGAMLVYVRQLQKS